MVPERDPSSKIQQIKSLETVEKIFGTESKNEKLVPGTPQTMEPLLTIR